MLSKAECFQLYNFFVIWNEMHDWLPVFVVALADKHIPFYNFICKWMIQTQHRLQHLFWSQQTFTDNPSESRFLCARSLWCHICITLRYRNSPMWFPIFNSRKMVSLRCFTVQRCKQNSLSISSEVLCNCWTIPAPLHKRLHPVQKVLREDSMVHITSLA